MGGGGVSDKNKTADENYFTCEMCIIRELGAKWTYLRTTWNTCIWIAVTLSRIRTQFYPEFPASALFAEINDMEIVTTSLLLFVCNQRVLLIQKHQ